MYDEKEYDRIIEPLDWRYSASIVGLYKFLNYFEKDGIEFCVTDDFLKFHSEDITEERYLQFVEYYYDTALQYRKAEKLLKKNDVNEEQRKLINDLIHDNAVLKKVFKNIKFEGQNQEEILNIISKNRELLIKETYRSKKNMYANYANTNLLFANRQERCRLWGYYVDGNRKSKSISYNFDTKTFVGKDDSIFDFIPFAFLGDYEAFFINDSFSVKQLIDINREFEYKVLNSTTKIEDGNKDTRKILFKTIQESADFLNYDVEVILKNKDCDFYETLFIRKESIDVLRKISIYDSFCFSYKVNDNYYINVQKEVLNCILNLTRTDKLIEMFLKENSQFLVTQFIKINFLICGGGEEMNKSMKVAYACAKEVLKQLPENKLDSYRQKLISSIVFKDYDRCCQVLLQLSNYANVPFDFAYDLFEDFEDNKDIAYTFINALSAKSKEN